MTALTIRNVPTDIVDWLKDLAQQHHRSVNRQVVALFSEWKSRMALANEPVLTTSNNARFALLQSAAKDFAAVAAASPDKRTADQILGYDDLGLPN